MPDRVVEVHLEPSEELWGRRTVRHAGERLEPLLLPGVELDIGALLAFVAGWPPGSVGAWRASTSS